MFAFLGGVKKGLREKGLHERAGLRAALDAAGEEIRAAPRRAVFSIMSVVVVDGGLSRALVEVVVASGVLSPDSS